MSNKFIIFGDSYSTYKGHIPEGFSSYYPYDDEEHAFAQFGFEETWWGRLINENGWELLHNNSWSGSTICYTGYNGFDCSRVNSFIYRYRKLKEDGFFEKNRVDTVLVFGGTNDNWADSPLGEIKLSDWEEKDLYNVLPAISYFMYCLKKDLPDTRIAFILNYGFKEEINEAFRTSAAHFGVDLIEIGDVEKGCGHPTSKGMEQIRDCVLDWYNK